MNFLVTPIGDSGVAVESLRTGRRWHFSVLANDGRRELSDGDAQGLAHAASMSSEAELADAYNAAFKVAGERELIDVVEGE